MERNRVSVMDFEKNQNVIQTAVDACAAVGGGTVIVPEGEWHTGKIHLQSNIHLQLEEGAKVVFSEDPQDYLPVVFTRWEGIECYNYSPLIYAHGCENIQITGKGTLVGSGQRWWAWKQTQQAAADRLYQMAVDGVPVEERIFGTEKDALRPQFIQMIHCKNIFLEGFSIVDGPQWTIHPVYCENVVVRNVQVRTTGHNTDGINPDSCRDVLIEGCMLETGDDCIAINAGMNEDGWRVNRPCENIEIRDCLMNGGHGGIVIGSAVSGGVRNVYAHDCKIQNTMQGIRLKSMRGRGGYVKDVKIENIEIHNVSNQAVQINMFYESSTVMPKTKAPSVCKDIEIRNVSGSGSRTAIQIKGLLEQPLEGIILENVDLQSDEALFCSGVRSIQMHNVNLRNS